MILRVEICTLATQRFQIFVPSRLANAKFAKHCVPVFLVLGIMSRVIVGKSAEEGRSDKKYPDKKEMLRIE